MFVFFVGRVVIRYGWINADGFQTQTTQFSPLKTAAQSPPDWVWILTDPK